MTQRRGDAEIPEVPQGAQRRLRRRGFALITLIMLVPGISTNWVVLVVVMAVLVPVVGAFVPDASHSAGKLADGLQPSSPTGFFESLPEGLPATPHVLLPPGNRIQVTKEENHLDHVTSLLLGQDSREVLAELTAVSRRTSRSERTIVEVRVEGAVVGGADCYIRRPPTAAR